MNEKKRQGERGIGFKVLFKMKSRKKLYCL